MRQPEVGKTAGWGSQVKSSSLSRILEQLFILGESEYNLIVSVVRQTESPIWVIHFFPVSLVFGGSMHSFLLIFFKADMFSTSFYYYYYY